MQMPFATEVALALRVAPSLHLPNTRWKDSYSLRSYVQSQLPALTPLVEELETAPEALGVLRPSCSMGQLRPILLVDGNMRLPVPNTHAITYLISTRFVWDTGQPLYFPSQLEPALGTWVRTLVAAISVLRHMNQAVNLYAALKHNVLTV